MDAYQRIKRLQAEARKIEQDGSVVNAQTAMTIMMYLIQRDIEEIEAEDPMIAFVDPVE